MDAKPAKIPAPAARYMSSLELETVRDLLMEYREVTQSRSGYLRASKIVTELGAGLVEINLVVPQ